MNGKDPLQRLARLEAQIEALSRRMDDSHSDLRCDIRRIVERLDNIAVQHERAKGELRRIWLIIVAAATVISNAAQALLTSLFNRP